MALFILTLLVPIAIMWFWKKERKSSLLRDVLFFIPLLVCGFWTLVELVLFAMLFTESIFWYTYLAYFTISLILGFRDRKHRKFWRANALYGFIVLAVLGFYRFICIALF